MVLVRRDGECSKCKDLTGVWTQQKPRLELGQDSTAISKGKAVQGDPEGVVE